MQIKEVTVSAALKWPHPVEQYSTLSASVAITATLDREDDYGSEVRRLQASADRLVQEQKQKIVASLGMRERSAATAATASTAAKLAEKHGKGDAW